MYFMVIENFYYFLYIFTFTKNQIFILCLLLMPKGFTLWVSQFKSFISENIFDLEKFSLSIEC